MQAEGRKEILSQHVCQISSKETKGKAAGFITVLACMALVFRGGRWAAQMNVTIPGGHSCKWVCALDAKHAVAGVS